MKDSKVELSNEEMEVVLKELADFLDYKHISKEETTKGTKDLKYNICDTENYFYKNFMVRGGIGHGCLKKGDKGIAFLYGENTMEKGVYIWLTYRPETKEVILKLGDSKKRNSKLDPQKKNKFNNKYKKEYKDNLDYKVITKDISELLDKFLKDERTQEFL